MDYIRQLNEFCSRSAGTLSAMAVNVYIRLFYINNRVHWAEWFPVTDSVLRDDCMIGSVNTVRAIRQQLKDLGYIDLKPGKGKKPTQYKIIRLYEDAGASIKAVDNSNVSLTDTYTDTYTDIYTDTLSDTYTDTNTDSLSYLNKTKNVRRKTESARARKFSPPSFVEVSEYIRENGYAIDAKAFYDYFTAGNWIDSKGNAVKSWKQKIITWHNHAGKTAPKKEWGNAVDDMAAEAIAELHAENTEAANTIDAEDAIWEDVPF